ncbi:sugar ABC transporter permease, partial [Rhizobium phaseoli]
MSVQRSAFIFAWILLLPAVLYVLAIVAYPLVDTFILSFTDASLKKTTNWVG